MQPPSSAAGDTPEIPQHYSDFVRNLVAEMVSPNPTDRPTAIELVTMIEKELEHESRPGEEVNTMDATKDMEKNDNNEHEDVWVLYDVDATDSLIVS